MSCVPSIGEGHVPLDGDPTGQTDRVRFGRRAANDVLLAGARSVWPTLTEELAAALKAARKIGVTDDDLARRTPQSWNGGTKRVYVDAAGEQVPYGSPAAAFSFKGEDDPALARFRKGR